MHMQRIFPADLPRGARPRHGVALALVVYTMEHFLKIKLIVIPNFFYMKYYKPTCDYG